MEIQLKRILLALAVVGLAVVAWGLLRKSRPPEVSFARAARQNLTSALPTNGKAEPIEWQSANAEIGGLVTKVSVRDGQAVERGAELATVTDPSIQADIAAGEAKVTEARANLSALEAGGRPAELAEIESGLSRARLDVEQEQKTYDSLERLVAKHAATREEADAARAKLRQSQLEIGNSKSGAPRWLRKPTWPRRRRGCSRLRARLTSLKSGRRKRRRVRRWPEWYTDWRCARERIWRRARPV